MLFRLPATQGHYLNILGLASIPGNQLRQLPVHCDEPRSLIIGKPQQIGIRYLPVPGKEIGGNHLAIGSEIGGPEGMFSELYKLAHQPNRVGGRTESDVKAGLHERRIKPLSTFGRFLQM